jgi:hypothetical protein
MDIAWLEIADPPELWRQFGFDVDAEGRCVIGGVEHRLIGDDADDASHIGEGIISWTVTGIDPLVTDIDGVPTTVIGGYDSGSAPEHPNGVFRIDHLVIRTPSTPRTAEALAAVGLERRGGRTTNSAGDSVDMTFFWAGDTLLELAGPPEPNDTGASARFAGIAYATADLDGTTALLDQLSTTPVQAVQPGRRIAALTKEAGSSVPIAFMTPHVRTR